MDDSDHVEFPEYISFTVTNTCNLACWMCGQWSETGYMHNRKDRLKHEMGLADWTRLVDEVAAHGVRRILLRGGEPFLAPWIIALLEYINRKGIFVSIDTNGTILKKHAQDIMRIGDIHLTISVDGPEEVHDAVRGVKGTFKRMQEGLELLRELESRNGRGINKTICFVISPVSVNGLGAMPGVARSLSIDSIAIVPYYYFPERIGKAYEKQLNGQFKCPAFSWRGFHHESSGIDFDVFIEQYRVYLANLGEIHSFPYMDFTQDDYRTWFGHATAPIGAPRCMNVERLIDIQPDGHANFCVDFPDYSFGNVKDAAIAELWNSDRAERFRACRRENPLPICHRCGAKYMGEIAE